MYLRLSQELVLKSDRAIGIFDFDNCTTGKRTLPLLERAQREGILRDFGDLPRSFILAADRGGTGEEIILSPVTSGTLSRRISESDSSKSV